MSANNVVIVRELEDKTYIVTDNCAEETVELDEGYFIGKAKTLDEAVDLAHKYEQEEIVEYGVSIIRLKDAKWLHENNTN